VHPVLAVVALVALVGGCGGATIGSAGDGAGGQAPVTSQYSAPTASRTQPSRGQAVVAGADLSGPIRASGGPFLRDRYGRVVILHGVNEVEKNPPYELTVAPGEPWNFSAADAKAIAGLGFDVVRLGILWQGLEPGTGGPNNPAVCAGGPPGNPHMYDAGVDRSYLAAVRRTVDLLGRYHVYTLLDMHQDVYNQVFRGEGAPAWAVCTDLLPPVALGGRWSSNYRNGALDVAVDHFWSNDVVGDLQGQYDQVWGTVAHAFAGNPWIIGYDPYNEPFAPEVTVDGTRVFATELECFYTGRAHPGKLDDDDRPVSCPPGDPRQGVIPTIERADPNHLVFVEPDIYSIRNQPDLLGPMDFPRLVLNFHAYCGQRSPLTGNPTNVDACADHIFTAMLRRVNERALMSSRAQPGGPPLFLSEFGATSSSALLDRVTRDAAVVDLGWAYWNWKSYDDPTGSADEALASPSGQLAPTAAVLSQPFAQAVAGTPVTTSFDSDSGIFQLVYEPIRSAAPTIVFVPAVRHYPAGYCSTVVGGRVISVPGASHLLVRASSGARQVSVTVAPGRCRPQGAATSPTS
jgi:endoglycosylceramidase